MGLWEWIRGRRRRPDLKVVFYTRTGCHLCEDAWLEIDALRRHHRFQLVERDVDTDPALVERFGMCVPVIEVNGKVRMRGRFNRVLFQRLLDADPGAPEAAEAASR